MSDKLSPSDQDYLDGLLAERAMLAQAKKKDRLAAVDKELARLGHRTGDESERAVVNPAKEKATVKDDK